MLDLQTITTGIISCKLLRQGLFLASYYDKDYFLQAITMEIISWKQWRRMLFLGSHNDEDYFLETITMKVISCKPLRRKWFLASHYDKDYFSFGNLKNILHSIAPLLEAVPFKMNKEWFYIFILEWQWVYLYKIHRNKGKIGKKNLNRAFWHLRTYPLELWKEQ